jgi:hypothetical protein
MSLIGALLEAIRRTMVRLACKLLVFIAVLLMPVGMTAAPAAVAQHHSASMPMRHCPEQSPKPSGKAGFAECTLACSAALPAADRSANDRLMIICEPIAPSTAQRLQGLHPETATPPPKRS